MSRFHFYTLDVFTDRRFGGNPLAVVLDAQSLSDGQMQTIAAEFNLSETVFVLPPTGPSALKRLRIFTPRMELPFAGHPTIGTSFLLAHLGLAQVDAAQPVMVLEEAIGEIPVSVRFGAHGPVATRMSVPKMPESGPAAPASADIAAMLSLGIDDLHATLPPTGWSCGVPFLFVPLRNRDAVARARLRTDLWERTLSKWWASKVFVFSFDTVTAQAQIHARVFAPGAGIAEDPATGGAVSALAGPLCESQPADGKFTWLVEQGFEMGRPSLINLEAVKQGGTLAAVHVGGSSVLVTEGWLEAGS